MTQVLIDTFQKYKEKLFPLKRGCSRCRSLMTFNLNDLMFIRRDNVVKLVGRCLICRRTDIQIKNKVIIDIAKHFGVREQLAEGRWNIN